MGNGQRDQDDNEWVRFLVETGHTTRLENDKAEPFRQRLRPFPRADEEDPGDDDLDTLVDLNIETADELLFVRPGVQKRVFQGLRRGQLPPQELLDLHGMRVTEARKELVRFLGFARRHRLRVVQIIHGKGSSAQGRQPILKQKVNQWLRQRKEVLAFCSAPRFDGGLGAAYVLLKRKSESRD